MKHKNTTSNIHSFLSDQASFICYKVSEKRKITATSPLTTISLYSQNKPMRDYDSHFIDEVIGGLERLSNLPNSQ